LNFSTAEPGTAAFNGNSDCELVLRAICVFDANGLLQVEGRFIIPLISRKNEVICINIAFCAPFNLMPDQTGHITPEISQSDCR